MLAYVFLHSFVYPQWVLTQITCPSIAPKVPGPHGALRPARPLAGRCLFLTIYAGLSPSGQSWLPLLPGCSLLLRLTRQAESALNSSELSSAFSAVCGRHPLGQATVFTAKALQLMAASSSLCTVCPSSPQPGDHQVLLHGFLHCSLSISAHSILALISLFLPASGYTAHQHSSIST